MADEVISNSEIYKELIKLGAHMDAMTSRNLIADQLHADHETRLRKLERWRYAWPSTAGLAALAAIVSTALAVVH